jgi:large subunit ribosomal protein L31e
LEKNKYEGLKMADLERQCNVPLRKGFRKTPKYKKAKKAIATLKLFLNRHMKSDKVLIGKNLNEKIWERGIKNPPHHVKVTAIKDGEGVVKAELEGFKYEVPKPKEEKSEGLMSKLKGKKESVKEKKDVDKVDASVKEEKPTTEIEKKPDSKVDKSVVEKK